MGRQRHALNPQHPVLERAIVGAAVAAAGGALGGAALGFVGRRAAVRCFGAEPHQSQGPPDNWPLPRSRGARQGIQRRRSVTRAAESSPSSAAKPETPVGSQASREAAISWLDASLSTPEGRALGRGVFLATSLEERKQRAKEGINTISDFLEEAAELAETDMATVVDELASGLTASDDEDDVMSADLHAQAFALGVDLGFEDDDDSFDFDEGPVKTVEDCVFLAVHFYSAEGGAWLGAETWPNAVMLQASVPGMSHEGVQDAVRRDLLPEAVSDDELRVVVDAFVSATWGGSGSPSAPRRLLIATSPQYAAIQYCTGILWGFALRGLVLRLALDRRLGTSPESVAIARRRLQRQFERPFMQPNSSAASIGSEGHAADALPGTTLMEYANEFFGHQDWAALCRPADAAVAVLETELEDALQGLCMISGVEAEDFEGVPAITIGNDDGTASLDDLVMLPQQDWEAFQRRAVAIGALLADAEALADTRAGMPLVTRGTRPAAQWIAQLISSGALSGVRREHGAMVARGLNAPLQRVLQALRNVFLASKLRTARRGLNRLYAKTAEPFSSSNSSDVGGV